MRELKFRAWIKEEKCYMGKWDDTLYPVTFSAVNDVGEYYSNNDLIVEQYTGLKDENGKEIYEGDIVTANGDWEEIDYADCYIVTFKDGCFRIGDGYENEVGSYLSNWRVIGNIHENADLMEEA